MQNRPTSAGTIASMILFALGGTAPPAHGGEVQLAPKQVYVRYCGACHGPDAKGDGVAGAFMKPRPPDLTVLASQNGGAFPLERIVKAIDGRDVPRAHGSPAMPVWGHILSEQFGGVDEQGPSVERRVQGRILLITAYLRAIQAK